MISVGRIIAVALIGLCSLPSTALAQRPEGAVSPYSLTVDDAIQRALERNLDIAVQRINPQLVDLTLAEGLAFYRPTVGFTLDNRSQSYPASTQLDGGDVTETDLNNFDFNLSQPVQWGGRQFQHHSQQRTK